VALENACEERARGFGIVDDQRPLRRRHQFSPRDFLFARSLA
jgi:hypothetical protein